MAHMTRFESRRVVGEPLDAAHIDLLAQLFADPRVMATMGGVRPREAAVLQVAENQRQWQHHGLGLWAWFDKATGRFIGRGGLRLEMVEGIREVELTYLLSQDTWGHGLATELGHASLVWGELYRGVRDVVAFTLPDNWRSRRVMQKLGMDYERDVSVSGYHQVLYRRRAGA